MDKRNLVLEVSNHFRPFSLIGSVGLLAEGGFGEIKTNGKMLRLKIIKYPQKHCHEAVDGVSLGARFVRQGRKSVESTVQNSVAVNKNQSVHRRNYILAARLFLS